MIAVTRRVVCHDGLSGEVGLTSHGALSPGNNLNFRTGFVAAEENYTGVTWSEVGVELKTTQTQT